MQRTGAERKATGRNAQGLKYDLLTALGTHACAGDKHLQRLTLRLITLVVARYNWATDELNIGQREISNLWSLDERSVKREMAKLKTMGWLTVKRAAARGRVAVYGLAIEDILAATRPDWVRIGSDYVARMTGAAPQGGQTQPSNVISFPVAAEPGLWPRMQAHLFREDPDLYGAWFAALTAEPVEQGTLTLTAPTRFHASYLTGNHLLRLTRLAQALDNTIVRLDLRTPR